MYNADAYASAYKINQAFSLAPMLILIGEVPN
jgi:hypothetical protein